MFSLQYASECSIKTSFLYEQHSVATRQVALSSLLLAVALARNSFNPEVSCFLRHSVNFFLSSRIFVFNFHAQYSANIHVD